MKIKKKIKKYYYETRRVYGKFPKLVWGSAAVFGIFALGIVFGYSLNNGFNSSEYKNLKKENTKYLDLINGYGELNTLYGFQNNNVSVILDPNIIYNYPNEFQQALGSLKGYRDKILLQQGRVIELRHQAGIVDRTNAQIR